MNVMVFPITGNSLGQPHCVSANAAEARLRQGSLHVNDDAHYFFLPVQGYQPAFDKYTYLGG